MQKFILILITFLLAGCNKEIYETGSHILLPPLEVKFSSIDFDPKSKVIVLKGEIFDGFKKQSLYDLDYLKYHSVFARIGKYDGINNEWQVERVDSINTKYFTITDTLSGDEVLQFYAFAYEPDKYEIGKLVEIFQ